MFKEPPLLPDGAPLRGNRRPSCLFLEPQLLPEGQPVDAEQPCGFRLVLSGMRQNVLEYVPVNLGMNRLVADANGDVVNPNSLTASVGANISPALFYTDNSTGPSRWLQVGLLREDTAQAVDEPSAVKGLSPIVTFYAVR